MKKLVIFLFVVLPLYAMEEGELVEIPKKFAPVYKAAGDIYAQLSQKQKNKFLEQGDCITMLGKIVGAIGENNHEETMKYYKRFTARTFLDYQWLNGNQEETFTQLVAELDSMVMEIQPQSIQNLLPSEQQAIGQQEAQEWLKKIVQNNTCEGLEWCSIFGKSDPTKKYPDPQALWCERLKIIGTYSQLKIMNDKN